MGALPRLTGMQLLGPRLDPLETLSPLPGVTELRLEGYSGGDDLPLLKRVFPGVRKLHILPQQERPPSMDLTPLADVEGLHISLANVGEVVGADLFPPGAITQSPRPRT
ncbi:MULTISPECIES: hypothetical protein [unclassified Streptomyces]|uniref:hypothetical protein n=1 Tax=unclassified Streptomyces TaxID=2593676 RepID=UPI00336A85F3